MATKGASPSQASPAAKVTACCSAMPTSYTRSGKTCVGRGAGRSGGTAWRRMGCLG